MHDQGYGLVMPFVVCQSSGGPYDDVSFVAGCQFAQLEAELSRMPAETVSAYVYPALVPQCDLLAMRFGYRFSYEAWDEYPDDWVLVSFTRNAFDQDEP